MNRSFAEVKRSFFDKGKVQRALDKKTRRILVRYGSFTRKVAQQSMRPKKHDIHSPPGVPPYAHGAKLLRKFVLFYYDDKDKTTIVGPILLAKPQSKKDMVPRLMETGGRISKIVKGQQVDRNYEPRPYMKPAHDVAVERVKRDYKGTF